MRAKSATLLKVKSSTYQRLSRNPTLRRKRSSTLKDIANSPDGLDQCPVLVQLAAQPVNEHIHNVCLRIETVIKNMFQDHRLGDRAVGAAHEIFQQGKLARLQLDLLA